MLQWRIRSRKKTSIAFNNFYSTEPSWLILIKKCEDGAYSSSKFRKKFGNDIYVCIRSDLFTNA